MKLNFFGDFVCQNPNKLRLGESLKYLIDKADYNIINFEAPVKQASDKNIIKSGPNIYQPKESIDWLIEHKFNGFALANNHMLDYGKNAARETCSLFPSGNIVGCGSLEDCYRPLILENKDIKVAIFSTTHREFSCVEDYDGFGCAWMDSPRLISEIKRIRPNVDFIIIYNHGGLEYCNYPLPQYRRLYRYWIEMGVDAVIGSHPHVPQGWEKFKGKSIIYSLGNFCFEKSDGNYPNYWNESLCAQFDFTKGIENLNIIPLHFLPEVSLIETNKDESFTSHLEYLNSILQDDPRYCDNIFQSLKEFVPTYRGMYSVSGYTRPAFELKFIKDIARKIIKPKKIKTVHHLNMYRCETHRWVMELLLEKGLLK